MLGGWHLLSEKLHSLKVVMRNGLNEGIIAREVSKENLQRLADRGAISCVEVLKSGQKLLGDSVHIEEGEEDWDSWIAVWYAGEERNKPYVVETMRNSLGIERLV